jgi:hypothetical protein
MLTIKGTIKVPRCWKRLVQAIFGDDEQQPERANSPEAAARIWEGEVKSGPVANDIPEPHYDDSRTVLGRTEEGGTIELDLCSGQYNYYGGCTIHDADGNVVYETGMGDAWDEFHDEEELVGEDGNTYVIKFEWEGEDPYEK